MTGLHKYHSMTLEEFKKTVYHTRTKVVLPTLDVRVDKTLFFIKGKFNLNKLEEYLNERYEEKYGGK